MCSLGLDRRRHAWRRNRVARANENLHVRRRRTLAVAAAVMLAAGLGLWLVAGPETPGPVVSSAAGEAAGLAARVPTERAAVIHPDLTDDPTAVPVYPTSTTVIVDETSWVDNGSTASAYAQVDPPGQRVLVLYARYRGELYVVQIEEARS